MAKKSIAAALLMVMVAWAEMSLAPMFLMAAGHVPPSPGVAGHKTAGHHVMPTGHPCCPRISNTENAASLVFAVSSLPSQDEHRCCFLQGPNNVPAPVSVGKRLARGIALAEVAELVPLQAESHVSPMTAVAPGPPPGLLDMVLRV
jgi:hypothetical protein